MDHTLYVRHTIFLDASFAIFGNAIKDSPLVDKSTESSVGIGYIYNF
ncbi:MipA/OmpV family protein [Enterobacter mori]